MSVSELKRSQVSSPTAGEREVKERVRDEEQNHVRHAGLEASACSLGTQGFTATGRGPDTVAGFPTGGGVGKEPEGNKVT